MKWRNDYGDVPRWYFGPAFQRGRRRSRWTGIIMAAALALAGCASKVPPVQPPRNAPPSTCADACEHIDRDLGCQNGGACMTVCQSIEDGSFAACVAAATSCPQADACGTVPTAP